MEQQDYDTWHGDIRRRLSGNRQAVVIHLTYGRGRICTGRWDSLYWEISF